MIELTQPSKSARLGAAAQQIHCLYDQALEIYHQLKDHEVDHGRLTRFAGHLPQKIHAPPSYDFGSRFWTPCQIRSLADEKGYRLPIVPLMKPATGLPGPSRKGTQFQL